MINKPTTRFGSKYGKVSHELTLWKIEGVFFTGLARWPPITGPMRLLNHNLALRIYISGVKHKPKASQERNYRERPSYNAVRCISTCYSRIVSKTRDAPLCSFLLTSSPIHATTTPTFGLTKPPRVLAPSAIHNFVDKPKVRVEILPPTVPISKVYFRPSRSLTFAHTTLIKNLPKVNSVTVNDAYTAAFASRSGPSTKKASIIKNT
jgi:hypothetical protein